MDLPGIARQKNLLVSRNCEVQLCGVTIRAPALPSMLASDTNSCTDSKAGARIAGTKDDLTRFAAFFHYHPNGTNDRQT